MPTGYTDAIKDGISFKEFTMGCARAFGACIDIRDEPSDFEIKEIEVSDYHKKELIKSEHQLNDLFYMTFNQASKKAKEKFIQDEKEYKDALKKRNELKSKYIEMLKQVYSWKPPTDEHMNLYNFMISQIKESIEFDCSTEHYKRPRELSAFEYHTLEIDNAVWSIEYNKKRLKKEIESVRGRNKWINDLKSSLEK